MRTVFLVLAVIFLFYVVRSYWKARATGGTGWEVMKASVKDSTTIAWARFVGLVGSLVDILLYAADWIGTPEIADAIRAMVTPEYAAYALLAMAVITELARRRRLS